MDIYIIIEVDVEEEVQEDVEEEVMNVEKIMDISIIIIISTPRTYCQN